VRVNEADRDEGGARFMDDVKQDMRFAWRSLVRQKAFTIVAVLTLAMGIGATTALFSVVKAVLLSPLPYGNPESLAVIWSSWKGFERTWLSYDEYEAYETEIPGIANAAIFSDGAVNFTEGDRPERARVGFIQHDVFELLGVAPLLGSGFTAEQDRPNGPNVIVLSHELWQRRFNGDLSVVGKTIQVNGAASTVVGVMPEGFKLPLDFGGSGPTLAWLPLGTDAQRNGATLGPAFTPGGGSHGFYGLARLKPGATTDQVNNQLVAFFKARVADGSVPETMNFKAYTIPVAEQVTGRIKGALLVVFGAVGFVLLIACANVAGLMLVRGEARRRELAVRVALGAGPKRLARQLLTESVVLAGVGGAIGVALAALSLWLVRITAPANLPRFTEARLDMSVLGFAVAATLGAAILAGLLPALQASQSAPAGDLNAGGGRSATAGLARIRWRQGLVAAEIALAVVLVVGAGLMVRTVANLFAVDAGFDSRNVLSMRLGTPAAFFPDSLAVTNFQDDLLRRVRELPGVKNAGLVRNLPLANQMGDWGVAIEGYTPPPNTGTPSDWQVVSPGYFETMGLSLKEGRFLSASDDMRGPLALVVNQRFVELYISGGNPIGKWVRIGGAPDSLRYHIVGVVGNVHHNGLTKEVKAQFYAPMAQFARSQRNTTRSFSLVVKTSSNPNSLLAPIRQIVQQLDPRIPIADVRTMDDVVKASIAEPRFAMGLLTLFGVLALLLASVGIFGIVAQTVAARSHEFGIRAALGATPTSLVSLSVRDGLVQTAAGLTAGILGALVLTRALSGLLEGVTPTDVPTFALVLAVTAAVATVATVLPARRAGRVDPMQVLNEG
jgi:putative ABC transport system permease protein